jgi:hypothetical protein
MVGASIGQVARTSVVGAGTGAATGAGDGVGDVGTAVSVSNPTDWICRMVRACIELGVAPKLLGAPMIRLVPVDVAAEMVVQCMRLGVSCAPQRQQGHTAVHRAVHKAVHTAVHTYHVMGHPESGIVPFMNVLAAAASYNGQSLNHARRRCAADDGGAHDAAHSADRPSLVPIVVPYMQWWKMIEARSTTAPAESRWRQLLTICHSEGFRVAPPLQFTDMGTREALGPIAHGTPELGEGYVQALCGSLA